MWSVPVVLVEPSGQMLGALVGVVVAAGVGPFAQGGLDEALGLAVGAWGVRVLCARGGYPAGGATWRSVGTCSRPRCRS